MELSPKFAYLPNGIIREIVAYTGATFKKRNGKYMGQIPKTDPRFALLLKIPKKKMNVMGGDLLDSRQDWLLPAHAARMGQEV